MEKYTKFHLNNFKNTILFYPNYKINKVIIYFRPRETVQLLQDNESVILPYKNKIITLLLITWYYSFLNIYKKDDCKHFNRC